MLKLVSVWKKASACLRHAMPSLQPVQALNVSVFPPLIYRRRSSVGFLPHRQATLCWAICWLLLRAVSYLCWTFDYGARLYGANILLDGRFEVSHKIIKTKANAWSRMWRIHHRYRRLGCDLLKLALRVWKKKTNATQETGIAADYQKHPTFDEHWHL